MGLLINYLLIPRARSVHVVLTVSLTWWHCTALRNLHHMAYPRSFLIEDRQLSRNYSSSNPSALAIFGDDVLLIADEGNHCIWKHDLAKDASLVLFAGKPRHSGSQDGSSTVDARFYCPRGLAVDKEIVYVSDYDSIRKIKDGTVTTIIKSGKHVYNHLILRKRAGGDALLASSRCRIMKIDLEKKGEMSLIAGDGKFVDINDPDSELSVDVRFSDIQQFAETWDKEGLVIFDSVTKDKFDIVRRGQKTRLKIVHERMGAYSSTFHAVYTFRGENILKRDLKSGRVETLTQLPTQDQSQYDKCCMFVNNDDGGPDRSLYFFEKPDSSYSSRDYRVNVVHLKPDPRWLLHGEYRASPFLSNDVVFKFEDDEIEFGASKAALSQKSDYFRGLFEFSEASREETDRSVICVTNVSPSAFSAILQFVQTGTVDVDEWGWGSAVGELLIAANHYLVSGLEKLCLDFMIEMISLETVLDFFNISYRLECKDLKERCIRFALENITELRLHPDFKKLDDALIKELLFG